MNGLSPSSLPADGAHADDWARELSGQLDFVRRLARSLVQDEQIAEDMVQETMLAAVARPPDRSLGLRVWLQSVLRRSILLHFRAERRRVARETLLLRETTGRNEGIDESGQALANLERGTMLGQAVARLGDPYRTVLILRFYDGLKPREIARRLDRSVHTVNTQLQRGVQKLREELDEASGGDRSVWMGALLPFALHGPDGWWPSGVQVPVVFSASIAVAATVALLTAAGLWFASDGTPLDESVAVRGFETPAIAAARSSPANVRSEDLSRSAVSLPEGPASARRDEARSLQLQVRSPRGPLAEARVVATQVSSFPPRSSRIVSSLDAGDERRLDVHSGGLRLPSDPPDAGELMTQERTTGIDGRVEFVLHGERAWSIRVEAEGHAPELLREPVPFSSQEQVVLLEPATDVLVDRGSFSLSYNVYCRLQSGFEGQSHDALLPRGHQQLRIPGVREGCYLFEAMSAGGVEVAQWSFPVRVEKEEVRLVDLSLGGMVPFEVEVQGAEPGVRPEFVHVASAQGPSWNSFAPVHDGIARFEGLPPGPADFRVLSGDTQIARVSGEIREEPGSLWIPLSAARGKLRVLHPGIDGEQIDWLLARRSDESGSPDVWVRLGDPRTGLDESTYLGLSSGTYRLWVTRDGTLRTWELEHDGGLFEIDARDPSPGRELSSLRVLRGAGLYPGAPVELEVQPGRWSSLDRNEGELRLQPGSYRLRIPLVGLGYATRIVEIPGQGSVSFEEPFPLRSVDVTGRPTGSPRRLRVHSADGRTLETVKRSLELTLDAEGRGRIELRPGTYLVSDRWDTVGELRIPEDGTAGRVTFE